MKRWVQFDRPGIVELVGRYGNIKGHWEAKPEYTNAHPQLELELNAPGDTYAFNGVEFSVCAGGGVLHYKDYPKQLNFINLDVDLLDRYLTTQQMPQSAAQQELIKAFIAITELNAAHGYAYLIPPYFDVLEYALLGGLGV
ncbi:hypothetical protein NHP190002_14880 [Helicobacter ailurogastricus]|uniref:hypothetical protein n=1 Tax=Helicobacter ailurogastricus TaxID=1578720 RepID=UPI00244D93A9|nr:hypothetical protein [Helicobacter ailurogastricus]GMB90767.1 hypothetical protein NHP190002_14880 [Helicobacter ailurogastricus]